MVVLCDLLLGKAEEKDQCRRAEGKGKYRKKITSQASELLEGDCLRVCVCVLQRQQRLLGVLQRAHDSSLLKEGYYKNWVR